MSFFEFMDEDENDFDKEEILFESKYSCDCGTTCTLQLETTPYDKTGLAFVVTNCGGPSDTVLSEVEIMKLIEFLTNFVGKGSNVKN